ncbi:hypothetical protein SAMN05421858_3706 [Haladaptatus litoreus]|uniref:FaeA-like protein n=1 Tax=Haladaptatus litoreus TaxID=553468 RepID=A0A1N7DKR9_9EURY|nr:ArsR family transcriptional regulator [Haladaptatus litoreus]SIR76426.1 hypothetical protein SAMN05421858_3706 [Haladaptatus litoreus]
MTRDSDTGKFSSEISDEEIVEFFESGERPFHSANEVADYFDQKRETAHRRLERLARKGEIEKVKLGPRSVVWWRKHATKSNST